MFVIDIPLNEEMQELIKQREAILMAYDYMTLAHAFITKSIEFMQEAGIVDEELSKFLVETMVPVPSFDDTLEELDRKIDKSGMKQVREMLISMLDGQAREEPEDEQGEMV